MCSRAGGPSGGDGRVHLRHAGAHGERLIKLIFLVDNLLVRTHSIIKIILADRPRAISFPGSHISTFLLNRRTPWRCWTRAPSCRGCSWRTPCGISQDSGNHVHFHRIYLLIGFRKSIPPQNCQLGILISKSEQ